MKIATDTVAAIAVISPWWLTYLSGVSEMAAVILPILGVTWLLIQIANFFWPRNDTEETTKRYPKDTNKETNAEINNNVDTK